MKKTIFGFLITLTLAFMLVGCSSIEQTKKEVEVELGSKLDVAPATYVSGSDEQLKEVTVDASKVDMDKVGEYTLTITYKSKSYETKVKVQDTTAPTILEDATVKVDFGTDVDLSKAKDIATDLSGVTVTFKDGSTTKTYEKAGQYDEDIIVVDKYENKAEGKVHVDVVDKNAPVFEGIPESITTTVGTELDLVKGITATDEEDGDITASIKVSDVDWNKEGEQTVTFSVSDNYGNETKQDVTLTISKKAEKKETASSGGGSTASSGGSSSSGGGSSSSGGGSSSGGSSGGSSNTQSDAGSSPGSSVQSSYIQAVYSKCSAMNPACIIGGASGGNWYTGTWAIKYSSAESAASSDASVISGATGGCPYAVTVSCGGWEYNPKAGWYCTVYVYYD